MIRVRCPKCKELLSLGDELGGKTHRCALCNVLMAVPAATQPAAKPTVPAMELPAAVPLLKPEEPMVVFPVEPAPHAVAVKPAPLSVEILDDQPIVVQVVATQPIVRATFDDYFRQSKAVEIEREKLEAAPLPDLSNGTVQPLPGRLPAAAEKLGPPLAYIGKRGPIPMWRWIVFAAVLFLIVAVTSSVVGLSFIQTEKRLILLSAGAIFLVIGTIGAASTMVPPVTNTANRRFWICERGIIWDGDGKVGYARWEDIHELFDDFKGEMVTVGQGAYTRRVISYRNVFRILLDGKIVTIYTDPLWADAMAYLWMQTSRAHFRVALKRIYEGQTAAFGVISIDRQGVHANDRMFAWAKIDDVELAKGTSQGYVFDLELKSGKTVSVDAHGVSLPETAFAVCKVMIEDTDKIGTEAVQPKEEANPFAI